MGEHFTVAQLAEREGVTPQQINGWITKEGLPTVEGAAKRTIDLDVFSAWYNLRMQSKRAHRAERTEHAAARRQAKLTGAAPQTPRSSAILRLSVEDRKLLAWSRGEGRGWALAAPKDAEQPFVDDYLELVNHLGAEHGTTEHKLLREAKDGKLYFLDPCEVVAFLAGQLAGAAESDGSVQLRDAINALSIAATHLAIWRGERRGLSAEERAAILEAAAAVPIVREAEE